MELDIIAHPGKLAASQQHAREVEETGFGAIWWTDSGRSAYLAASAAAQGVGSDTDWMDAAGDEVDIAKGEDP